jgi:hypothetical protein
VLLGLEVAVTIMCLIMLAIVGSCWGKAIRRKASAATAAAFRGG